MMPILRPSIWANSQRMGLQLLLFVVLAAGLVGAVSAINLKVGEMRILRPGDIDRVAVGQTAIISSSLLKNGQLLVFGEAPGVTTMHLWLRNGQESNIEFTVEAADYAMAVNSAVLRQKQGHVDELLAHVAGVETTVIGDKIVLSGQYDSAYSTLVTAVKTAYPEIFDLTESSRFAEVNEMLGHIPDINIRMVGNHFVLTGTIDNGYAEIVTTVQGQYIEIMDLTRKEETELPDDKMVLMHIKITEFKKSAADNLGINWSSNFAGPSAAFAGGEEFGASRIAGNGILLSPNSPSQTAGVAPGTADSSFGYFGIATEITSRINLAVSSGEALILAEPRLVARSGGEASFLAGGEVPIEIVTPTSAAIEFKQFGILLNIKPEVDRHNNIRASVETEISAVDKSVSVGNTPGFLTRRTTADILIESGETLVMSGLVDRALGRDNTALKGLGAIPVLGALFRSRAYRDSKTDLVIFVTPVVYDAGHQQNLDAVAGAEKRTSDFVESMRHSTFKLLD